MKIRRSATTTLTIDDLLTHFADVKSEGGQYKARCPAHDDLRVSLSITTGREGRILLKCFAGCTTKAICEAAGIAVADLFPPKHEKPPSRVTDTYIYLDAERKRLFRVCRRADKSFFQQRAVGQDWVTGLGTIIPVLYRLPEVIAGIRRGETVWVPEGEKDANNLRAVGLVATTSPMGAGKWRPEYSESLAGADVVILPDNDDPGQKHAEFVAQSLRDVAASVKVLLLPDLPRKGDVSDWLAAGGTADALWDMAEAEAEWEPGAPVSSPAYAGFPLTDLGNAERLIAAHGEGLRFNVDSEQWLRWDGARWRSDATGEVERLAVEIVRSLYDLLKDCPTQAERDALYKHTRSSESASRLKALVLLAQLHVSEKTPVQSTSLDADPWLLNVENGTLDLRTGRLRSHRREDHLTKLAPVAYDPSAECPRWERFLMEVLGENDALIGFTKRLCGYLLTGDTREQSFVILQGKGSNGKSIFVEVLRHVLGEYARDTPVTTFLENRDTNTSDLASLVGARLVTASEGEETSKFNEALLKKLSGQDAVTCRHLYKSLFTYTPTFKILFSTNEVPRIRSQNYSMKRRVKLLPFHVRFFYAHERKSPVRDEELLTKLLMEKSGILAWCVEGCMEWQKNGLGMPPQMAQEVDALFESMDPLLDFIEAECELHPRLEIESGELWRAYQAWCEAEKQKPVFKRASDFARNLCRRDSIEPGRDASHTKRLLRGIGLRKEGDPDDHNLWSETAALEPKQSYIKQVPDANGHQDRFFETSDMKFSHIESCEKSIVVSDGVRNPRGEENVPVDTCQPFDENTDIKKEGPGVNCENCNADDWRWEKLANNGAGGWVCRACRRVMESENE